MTPAEHYRALAAKCSARAHNEPRPEYRCLWQHLVRSYRLLGKQADRNSRIDVFYGQLPDYPAATWRRWQAASAATLCQMR
jgi:hypothetical protein